MCIRDRTITGTATLSNADGILTEGPLTLDNATLTLTGNIDGDVGDDAIRAGRSDEDITIQNSKVTIAAVSYTHLDVYKRQAFHRQALLNA